jgi:hypothetical protein
MKVYPAMEQGSEEWLAIRKGRPTASRFDKILTATGKVSSQSEDYIHELIAECFCPDFTAWFGNAMTERGKETEGEARDAFAAHTGLKLEQVGFVLADDGVCGCSPDSLILGPDGQHVAGLEIKCPAPKTHVSYVLGEGIPAEYRQQVHGSMAVTGLKQWHFWSYFPGMQPFHAVALRDDYTERLAKALADFVADYKKKMAAAIPKLKVTNHDNTEN